MFRLALGHTTTIFKGARGSFLKVRWLEHETDPLSSLSADIKNMWSFIPLPHSPSWNST